MGGRQGSRARIHFGTDGWRGVIAEDFTFANVRRVARAIGRLLRDAPATSPVLVGYDTRFLSREFAATAAREIAAEGLPVELASTFSPTPALGYAVASRSARGGLMITASHNPASYSGIKLKTAQGGPASPAETAKVEELLPDLLPPPPPTLPLSPFDPKPRYLTRLTEFVDIDRIRAAGLHVIIDPMYGAGQGYLATLLKQHGIAVQEIHGEVNPTFGGYHPEPMAAHLAELRESVRSLAAGGGLRIGIAFDGDADRVGALEETGTFVTSHQIFALLLIHLVTHRSLTGEVVKTFSTTRMIDRLAERYRLPLTETPIGFKYIAERIAQVPVLLGGEESGGIGFPPHLPERDGSLTALFLLECMAWEGKSLGELLRDLDRLVGPHRYGRVDLPLSDPARGEQVVDELRRSPPRTVGAGRRVQEVATLDGVKLLFTDGSWLLFRPSGTEPVLRLYSEAATEDQVAELLRFAQERASGKEGHSFTATKRKRGG